VRFFSHYVVLNEVKDLGMLELLPFEVLHFVQDDVVGEEGRSMMHDSSHGPGSGHESLVSGHR